MYWRGATREATNPPMSIDLDKAALAVEQLLNALGVDEGDHTVNTPMRAARAWAEHLAGYSQDPGGYLARTFSAPHDPGLVMVGGIRIVSTCAHHLERIVGTVTVAYRPRPGQPIVGLSKLARVVEGYARRLQVQERLGRQIADTIQDRLDPVGAAAIVTAAHGCMSLRGVRQPAAVTTTSAWAGGWSPPGDADTAAVLAEHNRSVAGFKGGAVW